MRIKLTKLMTKEAMSQSMIQDLLSLGITKNDKGTSIYELDYYELRHLLVMHRIRNEQDVDVEASANKWF